jgi:hypothetical protein
MSDKTHDLLKTQTTAQSLGALLKSPCLAPIHFGQSFQRRIVKNVLFILILSLAGSLMAPFVCGAADDRVSQYPPQLFKFSAAKEQQVRMMATNLNIPVPPEIRDFFNAARNGGYAAVTNTIERLGPEVLALYKNPGGSLPAWIPFWQPLTEVESAYETFATGGTKYPLAFGEGIIQSIPAGSIYFGGSDAGRMVVTALCESQAEGKPFYTLTQNALSDGRYEDYLRAMYGKRIYLPTTNDVDQALEEYKADAGLRYKQGQLRPGEDVRVVDGHVQVNGPVAVMGIHALLVKVILEHNPNSRFFLEESYLMDTIYPYLSPHGLIFELHHAPLVSLTPQVLDADNAFWTRECESLLGKWLKPDTSLSNLCAFAETVYGRKDRSHFTGDDAFVTNEFATQAFSKLRVSIAGLYGWRLLNKSKTDDPARLRAEADYAFRQAFALCPTNPEAVIRYANFLESEGRIGDAILLARTARKLAPDNVYFYNLLAQLQHTRAKSEDATH